MLRNGRVHNDLKQRVPGVRHCAQAIVARVDGPSVLSVLEQNISGSPVILSTLNFNDLVEGEVHAYRLIPADS